MTADILIVDDEADIRELVSDILKDQNYATRTAKNSDEALRAISERVPAVLLLDIWLQGSELDGLGILELVKKQHPSLAVIMISGHGNIETAVAAIRLGASDFIEKPFKEDRLLLTVAKALEVSRLRSENAELKARTSHDLQLVGVSQGMGQLRQAVDKVAVTSSRVLIHGASGTGKETVARSIHAKSPRANANFVRLDAAGMSATEVDAELFGAEEPGRPGHITKLGALERAHNGTLFIDEITELPLEVQGKLLRVLQEGAFNRNGGTARVEVDVRFIAANTQDIQASIATGLLREELFFRLSVVPLTLASLKDRREDIPELCRHFLKRAAEAGGLPKRELAEDALAMLQAYNWPGNIRQLRNMMEWIAIMSGDSGKPVTAAQLPQDVLYSNPLLARPEVNSDIMALPLRDARELFEKQYLAAQIERFGGNISRTSAFVGMERSALHRKLKMLGIHTGEEKLEKVG